MRLRNFNPHMNVRDIQTYESQFYTKPDVIDEPEHFQDQTPQLTLTSGAVSSDTEVSDPENPQEIVIPGEQAIAQLPATDDSAHTASSSHDSH